MRSSRSSSGQATPRRLTPREQEVAALLIQDLKPVCIAKRLIIERRTVYAHMDHIARKLELPSRKARIIVEALKDSHI